ncbi:MAG: isoprenyl transferase [Nitrospiria bacterium]
MPFFSENKMASTDEAELLERLNRKGLPAHVAIIMDGNGRWAAQRHLPRIAGHQKGTQSVRDVVTLAREIGIKNLTLYAFSNENWNRPIVEITQLMTLLEGFLVKELDTMMSNDIRFRTIGQIDRLQASVVRLIQSAEEKTRENEKMTLCLALSYGGRAEIIDAVKKVFEAFQQEKICLKDINEHLFSNHLYTLGIPDPDLMIRTSGEVRISNFFLWQMAYTELYFTKTLWPDFRRKDFIQALLDYQSRERRFGLVSRTDPSPR